MTLIADDQKLPTHTVQDSATAKAPATTRAGIISVTAYPAHPATAVPKRSTL